MTLAARTPRSAFVVSRETPSARGRKRVAPLARRISTWPRRHFGVREFVCSAFGEFLGLQMGVAVSFNLINGDLVPAAAHHLAWSLSLALGAVIGGAMGWWVARMSRQEPQRVAMR